MFKDQLKLFVRNGTMLLLSLTAPTVVKYLKGKIREVEDDYIVFDTGGPEGYSYIPMHAILCVDVVRDK